MRKIFIVLVCLFFVGNMFAAELVLVSEDGTKKIKSVDDNATSVFIVQEMPSIKSIEGLDKLNKLSFVQISFSDLSEMSEETWKSLKKIEYLKNISQTSSGSGDSLSKTTTEEVVYEKEGSNSSAIVVSKLFF